MEHIYHIGTKRRVFHLYRRRGLAYDDGIAIIRNEEHEELSREDIDRILSEYSDHLKQLTDKVEQLKKLYPDADAERIARFLNLDAGDVKNILNPPA